MRAGVLVVPDGSPMIVRGDGPLATTIGFAPGATGSFDLVTLDAAFSGVEDLQLDGVGAPSGSDLLVMNRGYNRVSNCYLSRSPGTALAIGKKNAAITHIVENTLVRDAQESGIRVHSVADGLTSGSTDGLWSNVDIGRADSPASFCNRPHRTSRTSTCGNPAFGPTMETATRDSGQPPARTSSSVARAKRTMATDFSSNAGAIDAS